MFNVSCSITKSNKAIRAWQVWWIEGPVCVCVFILSYHEDITVLREEALCVMLQLARVALKEQIGLVLQYVVPFLHPDERRQTNWIGGV